MRALILAAILFSINVIYASKLISKHDFDYTLNKALKILEDNPNISIFSVINHTEAAKKAGKTMQNAVVIIFGNPAAGTDFMKKYPSVAIDLPLKILIYQIDTKTYISSSDLDSIAKAHNIPASEPFIKGAKNMLQTLIERISQ